MRVTDPRQQTMLTNQMLTPVMNKPVMPSREVPVFPSVGGIGGGVVPTAEETTDSFEEYLSTLTTDDLDNLDLSGLNLGDINISSYEEIKAALTGGSVAPTTLEGLAQLYQQQVSLLQNVDTLENVDIDDRPYWYNTTVSGVLGQPSQYSGAEFRAATGLPDSFSIYDSGQGLTEENTQRAVALLSESASPLEAVSQYYGIDLQAANNPNSNYNNASKYGTDSGKLSEFQSIVEPILQQVIPYLQLTKGLRYDDALEYAYKNDPMIAALYNQYGVNLFRQTDDGSTYFFDPISGTESRTVEVKDSTFRDVGLALTIAAASAILGPAIGKALGGTPLANATGKALAAGFKTVASGGDFNDVLKSMVTAGVVDYGLSQLAENIDLQKTLNEFGENFGIGSEISLSGEYTTLADGTIVLTETMGTQGNLGDLLAGVADAIQNPSSWTPSSIEEANIIWNLAGEAVTTGGSLVGEGGLTVGTFYDLLKTAYGVYKDSNQPPPKLPNDFKIEIDSASGDPIIIDEDDNAVIGLPPPAVDETDDGGGGGGGGDSTDADSDVGEGDAGAATKQAQTDFWKGANSDEDIVARQLWELYTKILSGEVDGDSEYILGEYEKYTGSKEPPPDSKDQTGVSEGEPEKTEPEDDDEDEGGDLFGTGIFDSTIDPDTTVTPEVVVEPPPTPPTPPQPPTGGGDDIGDGGENGDGGTDGGVDEGGVDDTGGTGGGTDTGEGDGDGSGTGGGTGTGTGGGEGEGDGTGEGEGSGSGTGGGLGGRGTGMFTGGKSAGFDPQSFMASISYNPQLLTPFMPQNSRDYLAELLARLQQ
jgi:hypothetical protein